MNQSIQQVSENYGDVGIKEAEIFGKSQKTSVSDGKIEKFAIPGYCKMARSSDALVRASAFIQVSLRFQCSIFIL